MTAKRPLGRKTFKAPSVAANSAKTVKDEAAAAHDPLPYARLRVVEFTHMVMGPSIGVILGDLGADVIKVEPPKGDNTRRLLGSGAGYFPMYNRNKRSLVLDLKQQPPNTKD